MIRRWESGLSVVGIGFLVLVFGLAAAYVQHRAQQECTAAGGVVRPANLSEADWSCVYPTGEP